MTNFNQYNYQKAQQTLSKIKYLISVYIDNNIIALLDNITNEYLERQDIDYSHEIFHKTIAEYIQIASERTGLYGGTLNFESAHCQAIFLINHFYQGLLDSGLDGALNDAVNPNYKSMALVIANLNKALKDYACSKHIQSVKYHYIDSMDWEMRYMMTKILLATNDIHLTPPMDKWSTVQLSMCLFELIQNSMKNS